MENIRVSKQELLKVVTENREKHKTEYLEAIKAYRVKAADLLNQELQKIVSGDKFQVRFDLIKPESHEKEYDLAIKMLEMSVDETIEISQQEFNELVNDEWNWKYSFNNAYFSNHTYVGLHQISGSTGNLGEVGNIGLKPLDITFSEDEIL
ncbi:MAG: hypothetical protein ABFD07_14025 [Methanobacterium sp.]